MLEPAAVPIEARCFWHPETPAVQACDRCGTFGCTACLTWVDASRIWLCVNCITRQATGLPSLRGLATPTIWGLAACSGLDLLNLADHLISGTEASGVFNLGRGLAFIATAPLFCAWFHLAVRYVRALGVPLSVTPAGAVGSWLLPIRNLVKPFAIMRELLAVSGANQKGVDAWQASWVVGNIVFNVSTRVQSPPLSIASTVLTFVSAFTCYQVIKALTEAATRPVQRESVA